MKISDIKFHELFFMLTGITMLIALPFLTRFGFELWLVAKIFYFAGVISFLFHLKWRKFVL